ncbi:MULTISPECIES: PAS domain S-box protein [Natrialbaceae]|uniref:PAS domain S-box protein n=1 Tax=Natrialbaceae TaxID=1644061 RepID=UPI00207C7D63|nr:PAS domain S-box protein [Natronococcus sp. CG52]
MGSPGPTQDVTRDAIREFFSQTSKQSTPFFTEEIAEALECSPHGARSRLEDLVERGEIRTKRGDGSSRVWWKPQEDLSSSQQPGEEQFRAFVSAVQDYAIFLLDPDGNIASWNDGAKRIKGYSRDEILGEHFSAFYTDEDIANGVPEQNLEGAVTAGQIEDEGWRVQADGSRFWANVTITAIQDDEGELQGFTKVTRDMTERREYEQQLEVQAERLERQRDDLKEELDDVFERVDDAFYALDEELQFEYVNDHAEMYFDTPAGELLGRTPWEAIDVDEDDPLFEKYETALETQEPMSFERYSEPLGIWEIVRVYPSESGLSVYFRDITERKEREWQLERTHDLLERAERIADLGGWEIDPDTHEVFWTEHLFDIIGFSSDEEPPLVDALDVYHDEDRPIVESALEEAFEHGESFDIESRFETPSGEVRWLRVIGDPDVEDGNVVSLRGAVQDITERKERERKLQESNDRLEQFAYAASHDLQEPLRMVSSYLQLLENRYTDELDEDGEEFIEFAVDGAERMREMINGLLEYSRVETQGEPFEPVDLNAVLEDVLADLQFQIQEHDAEITIEELPMIKGDVSQLRQLFQNLLENAIEYSGDESPRVDVSATRSGDKWTVSVTDEGIGIDPEDQERIFEVFQRLHTEDEHVGTGIGLALCKRIVERHGVEIGVDSTLGEGATFWFTLQNPDDESSVRRT